MIQCEYSDQSAQYPEVVERLARRLVEHSANSAPTLPDDDSEGCDAVSLAGEWGLWEDVRVSLHL